MGTCPKFNTHKKFVVHFFIPMLLLPLTPPLLYLKLNKIKGPKMHSLFTFTFTFTSLHFHFTSLHFTINFRRVVPRTSLSTINFEESYTPYLRYRRLTLVESYTPYLRYRRLTLVESYSYLAIDDNFCRVVP